jgi:hypothetical protein
VGFQHSATSADLGFYAAPRAENAGASPLIANSTSIGSAAEFDLIYD